MTLQEWLDARNMTQAELARRMKMSAVYVWQVASENKPLTDGFAGRLVKTFGADALPIVAQSSLCESTNFSGNGQDGAE